MLRARLSRGILERVTGVAAAALATAALFLPAAQASAAGPGVGASGYVSLPSATAAQVRPTCAAPPSVGAAVCLSLIRTDVAQRAQRQAAPGQAPRGAGYGPPSLQSAYNLPSSSAGTGQVVAVVDACDYPAAASDLAVYRSPRRPETAATARDCPILPPPGTSPRSAARG